MFLAHEEQQIVAVDRVLCLEEEVPDEQVGPVSCTLKYHEAGVCGHTGKRLVRTRRIEMSPEEKERRMKGAGEGRGREKTKEKWKNRSLGLERRTRGSARSIIRGSTVDSTLSAKEKRKKIIPERKRGREREQELAATESRCWESIIDKNVQRRLNCSFHSWLGISTISHLLY